MTRDDVIAIAREAGSMDFGSDSATHVLTVDVLQRICELVAAKEREACARIAESEQYGEPANEYQDGCDSACKTIAKAIRARGHELALTEVVRLTKEIGQDL